MLPRRLEASARGARSQGQTARMNERRTSFDYEDLIACGRGDMFGPGNAQLPLPPMLMFDRISEISETGGANGKGRRAGGARRQARPLVFRLPFQE